MPTIRYISEQVRNRLVQNRPDQANPRDLREIDAAVRQAINERYNGVYLNVTLPSGETIPDGLLLATFEDIPIEDWKGRSRAQLPVMPVSLPKGIGVFEVADNDDPNAVYIPTLPGQFHMVDEQQFLSSCLITAMYTPYGSRIEFSTLINSEKLLMRLFVNDASAKDAAGNYIQGLNDPLSIPADWEAIIVDTVFKRFLPFVPSDNKTDVVTENNVGR